MSVVEPVSGSTARNASRELDVVVETCSDQLSGLRNDVRLLAAEAGASPELSSDLELVVSELATNVIRHTHAPTMRVGVRVEREGAVQHWTVQVDNDVVPAATDAASAIDAQSGGRGLRIVAAIMDDITVSEKQSRMTITASRAVTV